MKTAYWRFHILSAVMVVATTAYGVADKAYDQMDTIYPEGQRWNRAIRQGWYFTPQGSKIIPYDWAMALPTADGKAPFFSDENLKNYGYILQKPSKSNPDGLPIGFTRDDVPGGFAKDMVQESSYSAQAQLGVNCSACHTSNLATTDLSGKKVNIRIDGGVSYANFQMFVNDMDRAIFALNEDRGSLRKVFEEKYLERKEKSLTEKIQSPSKKSLIGKWFSTNTAPSTQEDLDDIQNNGGQRLLSEMWEQFQLFVDERSTWQRRNNAHGKVPDDRGGLYGPARNDAFGVIFNQSLGNILGIEENVRVPDAPVKYPVLWDAPVHDNVQWVGAAKNDENAGGPIARNIGQVLGVFGHMDINTESGATKGMCTSAKRVELEKHESWLRELRSPVWPKEILGDIDVEKARRGREIYAKNCQTCHQLIEISEELAQFKRDYLNLGDLKIHKKIGSKVSEFDAKYRSSTTNEDSHCKNFESQEQYRQFRLEQASGQLTRKANECLIDIEKVAKTDNKTSFRAYARTAKTGAFEGKQQKLFFDHVLEEEEPAFLVLRAMVARSIVGSVNHMSCANTPANRKVSYKAVFGGRIKSLQERFSQFTSGSATSSLGDRMNFMSSEVSSYKARPLNGIWSAAPYFHNGSAPTLREVIRKPEQRLRHGESFRFDCNNFDKKDVGIKCDPNSKNFNKIVRDDFHYKINNATETKALHNGKKVNVSSGNSNRGHNYGWDFNQDEQDDLLEYLKTL